MNQKSNDHIVKNRIKQVRLEKRKTQKELAKAVGLSDRAIAHYENGIREPKLETWIKLAEYLNVPVSYLQGISNDLFGWIDWEKTTGHSKREIQQEINRLEANGVIHKNEPLQQKVIKSIESLEYHLPTSNQGAIKFVDRSIRELQGKITDAFLEMPSVNNGVRFIPAGYKPKVKKGMNIETYKQLMELLNKTRWKLSDIPLYSDDNSETSTPNQWRR